MTRSWKDRYFGKIVDGSLRGGIFSMASIPFGSGCLFFPYAVSCVGPIIALILFIMVSLLSYWTLYILVWSGMKTGLMDYNKMLEELVGKKFRIFSDINNIILTIGCIMSYISIISSFSLCLIHDYFKIESTSFLKICLMFLMMIIFQIPLSLIRNMSKLQYASMLGTFALIYTILIMVFYLPSQLISNLKTNKIEWFKEKIDMSIFDCISIFLYGYCSHNGIFPVYQGLKNPTAKRNLKVLNRSIIVQISLYLIISGAGYFAAYPAIKEIILDSFCYMGAAIQIGKITLIICLTCIMAINYNIMRLSFKSMFYSGQLIPFKHEIIIATVLYCVMNYLTFYIENIVAIMGVIGGICTCVICYLNPIIIYLSCSGFGITHWKAICNIFIAIFMIGIGLISTFNSIFHMYKGSIK